MASVVDLYVIIKYSRFASFDGDPTYEGEINGMAEAFKTVSADGCPGNTDAVDFGPFL
jgi:hypothetical protein